MKAEDVFGLVGRWLNSPISARFMCSGRDISAKVSDCKPKVEPALPAVGGERHKIGLGITKPAS